MGKLFKWLFGLVFLLVVLVVAAVVILPMVVDPNDYKGEIVKVVKEETGRDLQINQDLNLTVFPWLGIETGGVSLSNREGFGDKPFARINELGLRVKLLPLLSKKVEVDTLVLKGLGLNLVRNKDGRTNWEDLAGKKKKEEKPVEKTSPGMVAFKVEGLQLQNARISWDDQQAGQKFVVKKVRLVTGTLAPGTEVPVKGGLEFTSTSPKLALVAEMRAQVKTNEAFDRYVISGLQLDLDGKGEGLPKGGMQVAAGADIEMDLAKGLLNVTGLSLDGPEASLSGNVKVSNLNGKQPHVNGDLALAQTNVKKLAALFGSKIETTDENALTKVSANLKLSQKGDVLKVDPFDIKLDDSTAKGFVHVLNPKGPVLRAKLNIDEINVDRYLPPPGEEEPEAAEEETKKGNPLKPLRKLDLEAEAGIGKLTVNNLRMQKVRLKVVNKEGVLTAKPMSAKLYGGEFDGETKINAKGKRPKIHAKKSLKGINIGPLLKDLNGEDRLLGTGTVNLNLRTVGLTEKAISRSLSGKANFKLRDGAYKGVNLAELIRSGGGLLGSGAKKGTGKDARTDFSSMSASVDIKKGVVTNNDLVAKSPLLRVSGKGKANLKNKSMDYLVTAELVASLQGQGGKGADKMTGVPIPVRIKGPFNDLSYTPDLSGALGGDVGAKIKGQEKRLKKQVESKAKEKLEGKLEGLLR